ncbi:MAG: hypothetical protein ACP5IO_00300 [Elusimicrobiales bacterium]
MIQILFSILFIVFFHITIFVLYPDTSQYGDYWLYGLCGIWSFLYLYFTTSKFYRSFPFDGFLKFIFFVVMIVSSLLIIPQQDGKSIMKKIYELKFPDFQQINRGKIKFLNAVILKNIPGIKDTFTDIEEKTKKLIREMQD